MTLPADVAILSPPLGCLHQFGSVDLKGASSIWGTVRSPMVPNQDYRMDGEGYQSVKCPRCSLQCDPCVTVHYHATVVLPLTEIQVSCSEQPPLSPDSVP
jgi:hypothetical protein